MSADTTGQPLAPVISLVWDKAQDGSYFAQMTVSGLASEQQAQAAVDHMQRLFCGGATGAYPMSAETTPGVAPCPWCGEVPDEALDVRGTAIECPSCGVSGPAGRDAAEAVEAWQRRAPQPVVAWMHEGDPRGNQ
ncbi:Lar family restriction alleviation protein [Paracidovorax cattleyae]|uniref:Restriction alleviation protein, Lar family n=1 Tax=Paracidovorax cattleyae TaxID=80868 RepID=A0A1H0REA8_9BURK|nr:Lar family restriction alleviation protein [Paracidovorax cattleyae]SDP27893.1 restriction alleviation protein, Lar family [Paracidovorax cattleyae]